jgi:hypothetical protein
MRRCHSGNETVYVIECMPFVSPHSILFAQVCNVAPIAGETKVWQYITLMKKVYLIDCPGVVPPGQETDEEKVMTSLINVVVPLYGLCLNRTSYFSIIFLVLAARHFIMIICNFFLARFAVCLRCKNPVTFVSLRKTGAPIRIPNPDSLGRYSLRNTVSFLRSVIFLLSAVDGGSAL